MKPGLVALLLVAALGLSLGLSGLHRSGVLDRAYSQVVVVACQGQDVYGTGWFINHDHVVTAYHVVAECSHPRLIRAPWVSNATVEAYDSELDIAVLRVANPPSWARGIPLTPSVSIGDPVYIIGYPIQIYEETKDLAAMSRIPRVASGTVSWIHPEKPIFQFDIPTDAGNSGGPVISKRTGGAVGLVVYARPGIVSEGYFGLRMDAVAKFLDEHGIEYCVAGNHAGLAVLLGLGAVAALGFLLRGVMP